MAGKAPSVRDAPSPKRPPIIAARVLRHPWGDAPRGWARCTLVVRWRLREDGTIWNVIEGVLDRQGRKVPRNQWPPSLDTLEYPMLDDQDCCIRLDVLSDPWDRLEDWLLDSGNAEDRTPHVKVIVR